MKDQKGKIRIFVGGGSFQGEKSNSLIFPPKYLKFFQVFQVRNNPAEFFNTNGP